MANFISRYANARIIVEPGIWGQKAEKAIQFDNGRYSTTDKKEIALLRNSRGFNVWLFEDKEG